MFLPAVLTVCNCSAYNTFKRVKLFFCFVFFFAFVDIFCCMGFYSCGTWFAWDIHTQLTQHGHDADDIFLDGRFGWILLQKLGNQHIHAVDDAMYIRFSICHHLWGNKGIIRTPFAFDLNQTFFLNGYFFFSRLHCRWFQRTVERELLVSNWRQCHVRQVNQLIY